MNRIPRPRSYRDPPQPYAAALAAGGYRAAGRGRGIPDPARAARSAVGRFRRASSDYKIGCTSAVMQQYLDIPHPCGGSVFARGVHDSGVSLRRPISSASASNAKSPFGSGAISRHRRRRSRRTRSRRRSRPICRRSRSSMTATRLANHGRADAGGGRFLCRRLRARQARRAIRRARSARCGRSCRDQRGFLLRAGA